MGFSVCSVMCNDGDLRLGGTTPVPNEGRVEICIGETWGTICDNSWDNNDATVACRALGFSAIGEWSPRRSNSLWLGCSDLIYNCFNNQRCCGCGLFLLWSWKLQHLPRQC